MSYSFDNSNRNLNGDDVDDYGVDQQMQEQYAPAPEHQHSSHDGASYGGGRRGPGPGRAAGGSRASSRGAPPRQSASRNSRPPTGASRSSVGGSKFQSINGDRMAGEDFTFLVEEGEF